MEEGLNSFKKSYRARFCHGGGSKIDVRPGQNVLKVIQDCFESCGRDLAIRSPSTSCCSTPIDKSERKTFLQSRRPKAGLTNAVERARNSVVSLCVSPLETVTDRGWSHESPLKPAINDCIADSKKGESPVPKGKTNNILKDAEAPCKIPLMFSDPEDDHGSVGSPPVEELKSSPALLLLLDDQNSPAAVKRHVEVENVEALQTGREKQVTLVQGMEQIATSSVQKEKSFSTVVLEAVATGALGKSYSATTSPSSPPPVKDQDTEIENECEFLIDESDSESSNWFSIPQKNKKLKKDGSATLVCQAQPSENEKIESKKGKNRKVQVEALTKQKMDDLDVTAYDFRETSESDLVSNSKGNVPKSQRQNSTPMGKTKKDTVRHGSANQKKDTSSEPEDEELLLSWSGLETQASDTEQHKTRVKPSGNLPMPSDGHQQEETVSQKKNRQSSKQVASRAPQRLVHKKQTAKQKLQKDTVAKTLVESPRKNLKKSVKKRSNKKPHLKREESSDSDPGEEEFEREPVKLNEVFTSPLRQKLESSVIQKLSKSKRRSGLKPKNLLHPLESLGGANCKTPEKSLQNLIDCVKNSERKQLSAEFSEKIPKKINCQTSKGVSSKPEDTESQVDSDSSSVQDVVRKKQKLPDVEMRSNKRKRNTQHKLQYSFAAEKPKSDKSGPVLELCDKQASRRKSREQDSTFSGNSEDLSYQMRDMFSNSISRHKIVLPSNTPNVRRTKRVRLKPLEYWRGERVNYKMMPSGELVVSGIVCPEKEPYRKFKQRKRGHKQKRDEPRNEIPANLGHTLVDKSKPAVVVDVETNQEIFLVCVNTESSHSCFFRDESIEIYKNLNTSDFSTGRLILKPLKQKGHQFVHLDTIAFHVIHGKIIVTLHKTSYCLSTGDFFYVPAGNGYNIYNLLNEDSVLLFTQLKRDS